MKASSLALAGVIATLSTQALAADPAPVIEAERAFAARAAEAGIAPAFLDFMAPDAIVFQPTPMKAREVYAGRPPAKTPKEGGTLLAWWPTWAGLSQSQDLGFTTGPAEVNGKRTVHYFTIWKKQADGSWKWVYDGGTPSDPSAAPGPGAPVAALPGGSSMSTASDTPFEQVTRAELHLARIAAADLAKAYRDVVTTDARVQGSKLAPAVTPDRVEQEVANRARVMTFEMLGGEASKAGDLAWTYGSARWTGGQGYYVRIWQRRGPDWRLVFDQILDAPAPAGTPAGPPTKPAAKPSGAKLKSN